MRAQERLEGLERITGHRFEDRALALRALTHPSAAENHSVADSYERLEFLGDSILGMIVAVRLYESFPEMDEGELTRLKIALVSGDMLSRVAGELGLGPLILMGESELGTGSRGMRSALENVYESVVGALYLDAGYEAAEGFVLSTLRDRITPELAESPQDPKSRLQEITQRDLHCTPEYRVVGERGPAHSPTFTTVVVVNGKRVGRGEGTSKKHAEAEAARDAIARLTGGAGVGGDAGAGGRQASALPDAPGRASD